MGRYQAAHAHTHVRPITKRVMLEALLLTVLSVIVMATVLGMQNRSFSLSSSSEVTSFGINAATEPVQSSTAAFETTMLVEGGVATITSGETYSISAKVESAKAYDDSIATAIPYDLLLAWGNMASTEVDSKISWEQSDRQGSVSGTLGGSDGVNVSSDYVITHVSNNHIVPANDRVAAGLATIKPSDYVRIDGRLADVRVRTYDSRMLTVETSTSRTDQGDGACEIIYVERIKINERTYK